MYKIYKIADNTTDDVYIGITKNRLCQRVASHKYNRRTTATQILDRGDYEIELIEETDDKTRERYWIENTENTVNKNIPCRTKEESQLFQRNYSKENYKLNPDYQKEYQRNYRKNNPSYQKIYREKHKEKASEYQKEYYKIHKVKKNIQRRKKYHYDKFWDGLNLIDISIFT